MLEVPKHLEYDICNYIQSMSPLKIIHPRKRKEIDEAIASAIVELLEVVGSRQEKVDDKTDVYNSIIRFTSTCKKKFANRLNFR